MSSESDGDAAELKVDGDDIGGVICVFSNDDDIGVISLCLMLLVIYWCVICEGDVGGTKGGRGGECAT